MHNNVLQTIKQFLGIAQNVTAFDMEIIFHINSAFMSLNQIGIRPDNIFSVISGDETWDDFLFDISNFEAVKSFIGLSVKLLFDPPSTSYVIESYKRQIDELTVRLSIQSDVYEKEEIYDG